MAKTVLKVALDISSACVGCLTKFMEISLVERYIAHNMYIVKHPANPDIAQTAPWKKTVQKANPTTTRKAAVDNKIHFVGTIGLLESTEEYGECIALAMSRMGGMSHPVDIAIEKKQMYWINQKHTFVSLGKWLRPDAATW